MWTWILALVLLAAVVALLYWLIVVTEGVYLGRRVVVWLYDLTADKYDGIKQYDADAEAFFVVNPLLKALGPVRAPLILDVATGTGRLAWFLLEQPTFNGRVVGLDASAGMLRIAAQKLRPYGARAGLVRQGAERLPFPEESFHAVGCLEALEFLADEKAALREMARVLRPGGVLMLTRRRGWEAQTFVGRYRSPAEVEALLVGLGLEETAVSPWQVDYDLVLARKPRRLA